MPQQSGSVPSLIVPGAPTGAGGPPTAARRIQLHFRVAYFTKWGQSLVLVGNGALLGNWSVKKGVQMRCHHEKDVLVWEALVPLPWQPKYSYKYVLVNGTDENGEPIVDKSETCEHVVTLPEGLRSGDVVEVLDTWVDRSYPGSILTSCAFTKVLRVTRPPLAVPRPVPRKEVVMGEVVVRLKVADYMLAPGQALYVSGSLPALGAWQPDQMMPLTEVEGLWWEGELRVPFSQFPFTFKYAVRDTPPANNAGAAPSGARPGGLTAALAATASASSLHNEAGILLEVGEARLVSLPLAGGANMGAPALLVCHDGFFRRDRMWRGAGVAVPVFSLRTRESVGCGEFLDLLKLVDLCNRTGLRLIQVLPVNDTSVYRMWWDSYPYSTLSVFALHPMYLALRALRRDLPQDLAEELEAARVVLDGRQVDYEATVAFKKAFARKVFDRYGAEVTHSPEFKAWVTENSGWLRPYAAFCFLRDLFQTSEHWSWGSLSSPPTKEVLDRLTSPQSDHYASILFTYYLQYHLHLQLLTVTRQAEAARVVLKGDLPIGVDKRSVDTWMEPQLFRMDKSTGAPPDMFDPNGQNWGFPTYNWEVMAQDGYTWWLRRLRHMAQYFQAYRIDHILGFFRIWEIPGDCVTGLLGHFRPSVPISRSELESRGIWDIERLTEPYIRGHLLIEIFGKMWTEVAAKYLVEYGDGCYRLRPQYATERAIMDIKVREDSPHWLIEETERIRRGLLRLRQNVVLLKDPEQRDAFYPRFQLMQSNSFKELDQSWKDALSWLHDDYYFRRQEELWRAGAMRKLPALMNATDMLVCGEDLGFVPACVPPVMQELGLVGLRIQRMATEPGQEFNSTAGYSYLTVASPSCHDVQPTRAWYEADPERRDRFYYTVVGGAGDPPPVCTPEIMRIVAHQHLHCPSLFTIFPMQDVMALSARYHDRPAQEEVINDPTNSKHYWRFRLHVTIEELCQDELLVGLMQDLLVTSGRAGDCL